MAEFINSLTGTRMGWRRSARRNTALRDTGLLTIAVRGAKPTPAPARKAPRAAAKTRTTPEEMRNSNEIR